MEMNGIKESFWGNELTGHGKDLNGKPPLFRPYQSNLAPGAKDGGKGTLGNIHKCAGMEGKD